jgi:PAS domain S-box-containing protein
MSDLDKHMDKLLKDLQSLRNEFNDFLYYLPDALLEIEIDLANPRLTYMNRMAGILFGYAEDDFLAGVAIPSLFAPGEYERAVEIIKGYISTNLAEQVEYVRSGRTNLYEFRMRRKNGSLFPAETQTSFVLNRKNIPVAMRTIVRDITARKQAEEARIAAVEAEARARAAELLNQTLAKEMAEHIAANGSNREVEENLIVSDRNKTVARTDNTVLSKRPKREVQPLAVHVPQNVETMEETPGNDFHLLLKDIIASARRSLQELTPESSAWKNVKQIEEKALHALELAAGMATARLVQNT